MRWLLWLPGIRALHLELQESADARILAEDRVARLEADNRRLLEMIEQERNRSEQAYQALVNIPYQQTYGTKIFPGGPGLAVVEPTPGFRSSEAPVSHSEQRHRASQRFIQQTRELWEKEHGASGAA